MTDAEKKPLGRPRKYAGKRPTWTIRLEENNGAKIKALAESTGRSISEVCEQQIIRSFRMEMMLDVLEREIAGLRRDVADRSVALRVAEQRLEDSEKTIESLSAQLENAQAKSNAIEAAETASWKRIGEAIEQGQRPLFTDDIEAIIELAVKRARES
jgi:hypothetical protein